jgi:hypothetical protein
MMATAGILGPVVFERHVLTLHVAGLFQATTECVQEVWVCVRRPGVEFSIQPSSRSRCTKASVDALSHVALFAPKNPMVGNFPGCCARTLNGQVAAEPPDEKSRRFS